MFVFPHRTAYYLSLLFSFLFFSLSLPIYITCLLILFFSFLFFSLSLSIYITCLLILLFFFIFVFAFAFPFFIASSLALMFYFYLRFMLLVKYCLHFNIHTTNLLHKFHLLFYFFFISFLFYFILFYFIFLDLASLIMDYTQSSLFCNVCFATFILHLSASFSYRILPLSSYLVHFNISLLFHLFSI